jgi:hypothetical protein
MKTVALTVAWIFLAAILHACLLALLWLMLFYTESTRLFFPPLDSIEVVPRLYLVAGCALTCLPSFATGLTLALIRESHRPVAAAFVGTLIVWSVAWHIGGCVSPFIIVAGAGLAALGSIAGTPSPNRLWTRSRGRAQCLFGILVLLNVAMVFVVMCYDVQ